MLPRQAITINDQPLGEAELTAQFGETTELQIACPPVPGARAAELRIGDIDLGPPGSTFGDPRWRWSWQPSFAAGIFAALLRVTDHDGTVHATPFELRIVPSKLDAERYEQLIMELQRDVAGIVWALAGGRAEAMPQPAGRRGLLEEYALVVERLADEAAGVCDSILAQPHERLRSEPAPVSLADTRRIDPPALADLAREPLDEVQAELVPRLQQALRPHLPAGQSQGSSGQAAGLLPRQLPGERTRRTWDLPEHRLLRHVLQSIVWRAEYLAGMLRHELDRRIASAVLLGTNPSPRVLEERRVRCLSAARALRRRLELPFFRSVGIWSGSSVTHLQRRDSKYRRLGRLYRQLRMAPFAAFDCAALWLPIADLPLLYEQWCVVRLIRALLPLGTVLRQELVAAGDSIDGRERRWTLRLRSHQPLLELRLPDGTRAVLRYQRRYAPTDGELGTLDSYVRIPDAAIEISGDGATRALIFDAKYRVDADGRAPQDALDDAYAYRGAIGTGDSRATIGSFLLFPGTVALETADRIGALPLVPGRPDGLAELLRCLIGQ